MKSTVKKRLKLLLTILITAAVTLAVCGGVVWFALGTEGRALLQGYFLIRERFVGDYEEGALADGALEGMVDSLGDRWSHYLDPEAYIAQQESRANSYVGIGCTISYEREEGWLILSVEPGGPCDVGGLKPGEIITAVDGVSVAGEERTEHTELTRGEAGTTVTVEVLAEDGSTRSVTLTRAQVETDPVSYQLLDNGIGLITISDFHSRCAEEAIAAVDDLMDQGATALIFDVRNNPGGYVSQLTELLDYLMPEGPIFRSKDKAGNETVTESDEHWVDLPMAVLCNADSYSAAEFFAGALQEAGQAVVVGEQTCGKGYSQQTYALANGGAMSISTAEYFTGAGTSFIGTGVVPDQTVSLTDEQSQQLLMGRLAPEDDPQLMAATALLS